jgi:hypothetical protein
VLVAKKAIFIIGCVLLSLVMLVALFDCMGRYEKPHYHALTGLLP